MKKKVHILLLIFLNVWGGIKAQNIEFSNDILKKHLLSSSSENEIAKDINGMSTETGKFPFRKR